MDVSVATVGLVLAVPIVAIAAVAIKPPSRGPVVYYQQRVRRHGRVFTVHKLRSMQTDAEALMGPVRASKTGDPRVTPIGRFLRRRLDEVPQLWNVFKGDMSFVGPRPERPEFVAELTRTILFYRQRNNLRPEAPLRFVLHQAPFGSLGFIQHFRNHQDRHSPKGRVIVTQAAGSSRDPVVSAMSIDLEDYFHVSVFDGIVPRDHWARMESRVVANTKGILDLFDECSLRSTFFVLGWVAERHPDLVNAIAQCGPEVASHGYAHRLIYVQTRSAFREDVRRAKQLLEDASGRRVTGYRAPSYSITARSCWALDVPGATTRLGPVNRPVAGGGYFRLSPYAWTRSGFSRLDRQEKCPAVFYLHPWEIDADQPQLAGGRLGRFPPSRNFECTEERLPHLLTDFKFGPIRDLVAAYRPEFNAASARAPLRYVW